MERMTDERLAEIEEMVCRATTWPAEKYFRELIEALKAERERIKELEDIAGNRTVAAQHAEDMMSIAEGRYEQAKARLDAVAKCQAFTAENFGRNTMVLLEEEVREALEQKDG